MVTLCFEAFVAAMRIKLRGEMECYQDGLVTLEHRRAEGNHAAHKLSHT